jgi:hypothetical protein
MLRWGLFILQRCHLIYEGLNYRNKRPYISAGLASLIERLLAFPLPLPRPARVKRLEPEDGASD